MKGTQIAAAILGSTLIAAPIQPAAANPIDCTILLCLTGGFPPSTECLAAKTEMIRRITPWPVEPPLQLWNCPMSIPSDVAQAIGMSNANLGPDGLTPEARRYRDGIEIYHIQAYYDYESGSEGNWHHADNTVVGHYDENGDFSWRNASYKRAPSWLHEATGVSPNREVSRTLRGVGMRYQDYEGNFSTEFVRY